MKASVIGLLLVGVLFIITIACSVDPDKYSKINDPTWKPVWSDEFDYTGKPDPAKWKYDIGGHGWGNVEQQYYTDRPENSTVKDGKLVITARSEEYENRYYTSARLKTHGLAQWLYGRFEIYAKLPQGKGIWSAVWLLPADYYKHPDWPKCGEIDVMENVGKGPGVIYGTVHTNKYNHMRGTQKSATTTVDDCYSAFHLYAIEWSPTRITWYVDDKEYYHFDKESDDVDVWPFTVPFSLIMNISVGGGFGGQVDDDIFPTSLVIDYVRVFQRSSGTQ